MPTDVESLATVWSIRLALVCLFVTFSCQILKRYSTLAKWCWFLGSLFSLLHAMAAMGWYHDWSHAAALEDTAKQTQELLGWRVGSGLYFNYLFVLLWLADSIWWLAKPKSFGSRPRILHFAVWGFLAFIAFNGAIVFESGITRSTSIVGLILLIVCWRKRPGNASAASP